MPFTIKADLPDLDEFLASHAPHLVPQVGQPVVAPSTNPLGALPTQGFSSTATAPKPHRSLLRKVGGVLGRIGDIAESTFAPEAALLTPGTQLNKAWEERRRERRALAESEAAQRQAEAGRLRAEVAAGLPGAQASEAAGRGALSQAQVAAGLPTAQAGEALGRGELSAEQSKIYADALQAMNDPGIKQAFTVLSSDPNDPKISAAARRQAMATISQSPIGMLPMLRGELSGAEDIYRQGEIGSRLGPTVLQDNGDGTYSRVLLSHEGAPMGAINTPPPSGLVPHETNTFRMATDAHGNEFLVPVTTTTKPILPGAPKGGVGAGKKEIPIGHKPLSAAAKAQIGYIDTTLGTLDMLSQEVQKIQAQQQSGQLSDVAAKRALWLAYNAGFSSDMSSMMAGVSLTSILGSLAYMKGTRAYRWIQQIQQHLPKPTDSFDLMLDKVQNAQRMLPWVKYGALVTEGLMPPNARSPVWNTKTGEIGMKYADGKVVPMPF